MSLRAVRRGNLYFDKAMTEGGLFLAKYDENTPHFILLFCFFSVQYRMDIYKVGKNTEKGGDWT